MHPLIETGLAFILFLPTFAILGVLYWVYPRQPRPRGRALADALVLIGAAAISIWAMRWGFVAVAGSGGHMWQQIMATLMAYGVFLASMLVATLVRAWLLRKVQAR